MYPVITPSGPFIPHIHHRGHFGDIITVYCYAQFVIFPITPKLYVLIGRTTRTTTDPAWHHWCNGLIYNNLHNSISVKLETGFLSLTLFPISDDFIKTNRSKSIKFSDHVLQRWTFLKDHMTQSQTWLNLDTIGRDSDVNG